MGRSTRFDYVPCKRKAGQYPSPDMYSSLDQPTVRAGRFSERNVSFGPSRYRLKKLYIDQIINGSRQLPGPGTNHPPADWNPLTDSSLSKVSPCYSMGRRLDHFKNSLEKQARLPGPQTYETLPHDFAGNRYSRSSGLKSSLSKVMRNDIGSSFQKANDRWVAPTEKPHAPSPNKYTINSQFKTEANTQRTKNCGFGTAKHP